MRTVAILLGCLLVVGIVVLVLLVRKRRHTSAMIAGFLCAAILAALAAVSIIGKPIDYMNQTKENYLAMVEDKDIASFRVVVDDKITNKFPEWDDENPLQYRIDYQMSTVRISTGRQD